MNAHTMRIIEKMIIMLHEYKEEELSLRTLVDGLEGSLNAVEEKLPESFYSSWFNHWGELEQYLAVGNEKKFRKEIIENIEALEGLLSNIV